MKIKFPWSHDKRLPGSELFSEDGIRTLLAAPIYVLWSLVRLVTTAPISALYFLIAPKFKIYEVMDCAKRNEDGTISRHYSQGGIDDFLKLPIDDAYWIKNRELHIKKTTEERTIN